MGEIASQQTFGRLSGAYLLVCPPGPGRQVSFTTVWKPRGDRPWGGRSAFIEKKRGLRLSEVGGRGAEGLEGD